MEEEVMLYRVFRHTGILGSLLLLANVASAADYNANDGEFNSRASSLALQVGATTEASLTSTGIFAVANSVTAIEYCDENGANCFTATSVGSSPWVDDGSGNLEYIHETGDIRAYTYSNIADDTKKDYEMYRARGTEGTPAAVIDNDQLGSIRYLAYGTSGFYSGAQIAARVNDAAVGQYAATELLFRVSNGGSAVQERMKLTPTGELVIGITDETLFDDGESNGVIQTYGDMTALAIGNTTGDKPDLDLYRARGTTGSRLKVENGDDLGTIRFSGWDGDTYEKGASIEAIVDASTGNDDVPAKLAFFTREDGDTDTTERMTITHDGLVGIGTSAPSAALDVSGSIAANEYCDEDGANCFTTASVGGGSSSIDGLSDAISNAASASIFVGESAGASATGVQNTALGHEALRNASTGYNTAVGYYALRNTSTGDDNTAVGRNAGYSLTTGRRNTAIGMQALDDSTGAESNVAIGWMSLGSNGDPGFNVAVGQQAGASIAGDGNVAIGRNAFYYTASGDLNTALGYNTGQNQTSGSENIVIGANQQLANLTGSNQLNIGGAIYGTGISSTTPLIGIGTSTPSVTLHVSNTLMVNQGIENNGVLVGSDSAHYVMVSGDLSTPGEEGIMLLAAPEEEGNLISIGSDIGNDKEASFVLVDNVGGNLASISLITSNQAGDYPHMSIGDAAFSASSDMWLGTGASGIANPTMTLQANGQVGIGVTQTTAALDVSGSIHSNALHGLTSSESSVSVGPNTGDASLNPRNTFVGWRAGINASDESGFSGGYNTFIGANTGEDISTGYNNIIVGEAAGTNVSTGNHNTILGTDSGDNVTSGSSNTIIGYAAAGNNSSGAQATSTGSNNIIIGNYAKSSGSSSSYFLNIGNTLYGDLQNGEIGIGTSATSVALDVSGSIEYTGTITDVSDKRLKTDIQALPNGQLDNLASLKGVSFKMKDNISAGDELGFIAQDVREVYPDLIKEGDTGMLSMNYVGLIAPMVEAMKELKAQNDLLRTENEAIKQRLDALEAK